MRTLTIFSIVSTDSQDTAEQILSWLPLAALGPLSCTCKALRAAVAAASTAWFGGHARDVPSLHPARRAMTVRSYLQQQRVIDDNISSRKCSSAEQHFAATDWYAASDLGASPHAAVRLKQLRAMQVKPGA